MSDLNYNECLEKIYQLGRFGIKLELDTILNILRLLNYPHKNYKTIHIAGTNGKGSTATFLASILTSAGFKTGLFTSPHLVKFNERICINGKQISDQDVLKAYNAIDSVDIGKRKATFFEVSAAMAFYHFSQAQVDWAVIETGMGGRFDATNIVNPELSIITNLSIEHTDYLGNTIKDLAKEKGGIIKQNTPVVTAVNQPSGVKVIKALAKEKKSKIYSYKNDFNIRKTSKEQSYNYSGIKSGYKKLSIPLPGDHQKENLSLALAALEIISMKNKGKDKRYPITQKNIRTGLANAKWPGRLEYIQNNPLVIIDGAHNKKAANILGKHLLSNFADKKITLVVGILDDKPYEEMLKSLVTCVHRVIITKAKIGRSIEPELLLKTARQFFKNELHIINDVKEAVDFAVKTSSEQDAVCIAGSLYVAGEAKEKFDQK